MDDSPVSALEQALAASPDNLKLRLLVVRGWLAENRASDAARVASECEPTSVGDEPTSRELGRALRLGGRAADALAHLIGTAPETFVERARALLALERVSEAREAYQRGVDANATVEDPDLARSLAPSSEGKPARLGHLRVVSNDDTDAPAVDRLLRPEPKPVTFADVGGLREMKEEVQRRIVLPFQKPSLYARFKKRVGGGVLLYGPPGCGKTLLARATAGECKAHFLSIAISDVLDMYIGESERKLHAAFDHARKRTPAVLFFDELEALAGKRKNSRDGVAAKVVSQFLAEMDGFAQDNQGVLVLGATNVPWEIDAAFRRPGRFDRVLFVPPPDRDARRAILEIHLAGRPVANGIDADKIAQRTSGFSGADLENVVETAADAAIAASLAANTEVPIERSHLDAALAIVKPTTTEWLSTARNYARYANEAGQYDEVLAFLAKHGKS
jgi:SpoVK/Ycf46/Vps4 family AAA+-type ATPase